MSAALYLLFLFFKEAEGRFYYFLALILKDGYSQNMLTAPF